MCGIAGSLSTREARPRDVESTLEAITQRMETRGPDAGGMWIAPGRTVALGHRRLSIIDPLARSDQPMHSAEGRYTIVFNGEIYNYRELKAELAQKGRKFRTTGDTEVILAMFAEYGEEMPLRLRGMYAFGIWDAEQQKLFLARDPFGIKPLYYTLTNGHFYFASQVKALLAVPGVDMREEPAGHVGFFVWGSVPEPYTLYRGIHCLPSGSSMQVSRDGCTTPRRFASPVEEFSRYEPGDLPRSQEECYERVHAALEESVRMHEIADVPVAIFLSAGIDSAMITSLAAERTHDIETLTLGFDLQRGTENDETGLAARTAEDLGLPHFSEYIDQAMFAEHRERVREQMDQPTIDGVNVYFVSWLARQRGLKVALSGLGGDELFGGYPSFRQVPPIVRTLGMMGGIPGVGREWRVLTAPMMSRFTSPKYASLLEYGGTWGGAYLLRRGLFMPWELPEFLDADLVRQGWGDLGSIEQMNALVKPLRRPPGAGEDQRDFLRVSALEMTYYMRTQLLRDADWAGMAHSVEIRVPFVDMGLVRQMAPLRASTYFPRKPKIAETLRKPLRPELLQRRKTGFNIPVREWMQATPQRGLRMWSRYVYETLSAPRPTVSHAHRLLGSAS
ncbi:MAG: asparagine synthase (glutamine-hydrolyzing) [Silvibacterium sp.]|nr:asparagine synthase (glutamine-hydrolyzing) [Silvibacterium sp.]